MSSTASPGRGCFAFAAIYSLPGTLPWPANRARRATTRGPIQLPVGSRLAWLLLSIGCACRAPDAAASDFAEVAGARIVNQTAVTARTLALTVRSTAFDADTAVEVILPVGYASDSGRRWPVTYYLAGTAHTQSTFRAVYGGENLTAGYGSIVVAPRGDSGYWSDWFNLGSGGPPRYETFVATQLIPLIDANFRTRGERAYRAVIGESMGGYGAMMLAARHPDLFVAVASLSGAVDTSFVPGSLALNVSSTLMLDVPGAIYGPRLTEEVRWRGHNPADLATNLRSLNVQPLTGNGVLGLAQGETLVEGAGCAIEAVVFMENTTVHNTLAANGIPHMWHPYSWGCHGVALFRQQIREALPGLRAAFGSRAPEVFDYRSIEPVFSIFGWSVRADPQRALEFLDLKQVSRHGLTLAGSGTVTVTTPPLYAPGRPVRVIAAGIEKTVVTDAAGHLTFAVSLGQANAGQQYRLGSTTAVVTVAVRLLED